MWDIAKNARPSPTTGQQRFATWSWLAGQGWTSAPKELSIKSEMRPEHLGDGNIIGILRSLSPNDVKMFLKETLGFIRKRGEERTVQGDAYT